MRFGMLVAVALVGCAHGKPNNGDVDAAPDTPVVVDSGCGALPCQAIYVAPSGSDTAAGTKDAPVQTIAAGLAKAAAAAPAEAVFVQAGSYAEALVVPSGVTIYGGFDASWNRAGSAATEITGASPAVTFQAITATSGLDHVTVKSTDASQPGESSIAVLVTGSSMMVELRTVTLLPGNGAPGKDGGNGVAAAGGAAGSDGHPGVEHSTAFLCNNNPLPAAGAGGTSTCGRAGGAGGAPGVGSGTGATGAPGAGGTPGGVGGATTKPGTAGTPGVNGTPGMLGSGGMETGVFAGAVYMPSDGGNGTAGGNANGGGGGGGGGGGTNNCDSSGSSGGGGGGGGCGASPATGGTGGGGSFGLVAVDSHVNVTASMITAGAGGAGGRGGQGGAGGIGGAGGAGGPYGGSNDQDDGGNGAGGGKGGDGGNGGHGGGGGGGPSAGVVCVGTATISLLQGTMPAGGTGGAAGASSGNPGAPGLSTRSIGCSFF